MIKIIRGIGVVHTGNVAYLPAHKAPKTAHIDVVTLSGYVGLLLVQLNVLPAIWQAIQTGVAAPISSVLMMVVGLALYLYNSVETGNRLYTIGNAIGFVCNLILLFVIIVRMIK
jgi:uncharacterized protein with PQ loop repeat